MKFWVENSAHFFVSFFTHNAAARCWSPRAAFNVKIILHNFLIGILCILPIDRFPDMCYTLVTVKERRK